ncbi:Polyketide cyclase / dehydrase and lipid transport [Parafrankia irregularis]|uniref:Polyketide cyclase / dehydrase and lipid transport n=1 Tax=Parafrankia irregularis TaxID=795642 RepID=A0A0S4QY40_9ACTN|nr:MULTISPECIES: SRPBCC family protein [Frankiaceae]KPM54647.1 cyclase [Frankia sp. R43]MBE3206372.1 SRPBCC family protein [Parafrankia sp. CH37]CUU60063.1 Polyketide cyclase / dehydrase and lipid transport [Parafrankia irregularis]
MADHAQSSIVIDARPAVVMGAIADIAAYPTWVGQIEEAEILAVGPEGRPQQARFRINAVVVKDEFVNEYVWKGDEQVSWSLVSGQTMSAQDGGYTLRDLGDGRTEVTYELTVELKVKIPGILRRKVQTGIVDAALKDLKKHVEKLAES